MQEPQSVIGNLKGLSRLLAIELVRLHQRRAACRLDRDYFSPISNSGTTHRLKLHSSNWVKCEGSVVSIRLLPRGQAVARIEATTAGQDSIKIGSGQAHIRNVLSQIDDYSQK